MMLGLLSMHADASQGCILVEMFTATPLFKVLFDGC